MHKTRTFQIIINSTDKLQSQAIQWKYTGKNLMLSGTPKEYIRNSNNTNTNYTSQQDFGTRKVYCVSNVTFHAKSKYAIKIFPSPTVFIQWPF